MGETLIYRIISLLGLKNQFSLKNHKAYKGNKKVWPIQRKKINQQKLYLQEDSRSIRQRFLKQNNYIKNAQKIKEDMEKI